MKSLLVALCLLNFVFFCSSVFAATAALVLVDRIEASVNGAPLLHSDVRRWVALMPLRRQLDPFFQDSKTSEPVTMSAIQAVQHLIEENLITQNFPTQDAEVEQHINSIQASNHLTRDKLRSALEEQGFKFADYFELIRISLSKQVLIERDIRPKIPQIRDTDILLEFYNQKRNTATSHLLYKIQIHQIPFAKYQTIQNTRIVAQKAAESIRSGTPFEVVAGSDEALLLSEDQLSKEIKAVVKKLKQGEVSDPFEIQGAGLALIKLLDIQSDNPVAYQEAKEEIRNQLYVTEFKKQVRIWLDRQIQKSFIHHYGQ